MYFSTDERLMKIDVTEANMEHWILWCNPRCDPYRVKSEDERMWRVHGAVVSRYRSRGCLIIVVAFV